MIDLHLHCGTLPGDPLAPEIACVASRLGYRGVALLARVSGVELPECMPPLLAACRRASLYGGCEVLAGVELVEAAPPLLADAVELARKMGAQLVCAHGELPGGSAPEGTTAAAIEAGVDIVLHPGSLRESEAVLAAERGVALELSLCPEYGFYNGHIAALALRYGASLVCGSNSRRLESLSPIARRRALLQGAGLNAAAVDALDAACLRLMSESLRR